MADLGLPSSAEMHGTTAPERRRPRSKAYRSLSHEPPPDLLRLLRWAGLRVVDVERRAGMARGSFQRVLAARRGRRMGLPTAGRLAKAIGVPLQVFDAALERTLDDREEFLRRCAAAERVRREAESPAEALLAAAAAL